MVKPRTGPIERPWVIHDRFERPFLMDRSKTPPTLHIQPWRFVEYVLDAYHRHPAIVVDMGDWPRILIDFAPAASDAQP